MDPELSYLEIAMQEAEHASEAGTYPIGAIIVNPEGEIIGRGYNHVYDRGDYTSHAEMEAIRNAGCRLMKKPNFNSCTLYTTLEPCLMCCGAILLARIVRVIWVKNDDLYGALRCLCKQNHCQNGATQEEDKGCGVDRDCVVTSDESGQAIVLANSFQGADLQGSLSRERFPSLSLLPGGYAEKIASLSIIYEPERDLARKMDSWMNRWNALKQTRLTYWENMRVER